MHTLHHPHPALSTVTVACGALGATAPWLLDEPIAVRGALAFAFCIGAVAAGIDADTGRLPNRYVVLCALPALALVAAELAAGRGTDAMTGAVWGASALAGPLLVVHVAAPGAMGFGDVKFAAALGLGLGLVDPVAALLALCLACAVTLVAAALTRRGSLAFGPGLVAGSAAALLPIALVSTGALPWR